MEFILIAVKEIDFHGNQYYMGKTYMYQLEHYACTTSDRKEARVYKSKKIAENSCYKLNKKVANYEFEVIEI